MWPVRIKYFFSLWIISLRLFLLYIYLTKYLISNRKNNQGGCGGKRKESLDVILPLQGGEGDLDSGLTLVHPPLCFQHPPSPPSLASSSGMKSSVQCLGLTPPSGSFQAPHQNPRPLYRLCGEAGRGMESWGGRRKRADEKKKCCFSSWGGVL